MMDTEILFRRYIELKHKADELNDEIESLKGELFSKVSDLIDENGEKFFEFEGYTFSVQYRRTYEYPEHIKKLEEELKTSKKASELSGEALRKSETGFVVMKKK